MHPKRIINKAFGPVCALGAGIGVASSLWLVLHTFTQPDEARQLIVWLLLCSLLMLAGWVGVRFFPRQRVWPGAAMLFSVPVCVWCGIAGPGALLGISYTVIPEMLDGYAFEPLVYAALPGMIAAGLCALAFAFIGMAWLVVDVRGLVLHEPPYEPEPKPSRADRYIGGGEERVLISQDTPVTDKTIVSPARPAKPRVFADPAFVAALPARPADAPAPEPGQEDVPYTLQPFDEIGRDAEKSPKPPPAENLGATRPMVRSRPRKPANPPPAMPAPPAVAAQRRQPPSPRTSEAPGGQKKGPLLKEKLSGIGGKWFAPKQAASPAPKAADTPPLPPAPPAESRPMMNNPYVLDEVPDNHKSEHNE